ncbi:MAG: enoyl-CoA hydratase/isomerase family protein [Phycisphaerales bacterium]
MIRVDRDGDVRVITLDNPPVNAMTPEMLDALRAAIDADDDARAILLRADHTCFSAGFDLKAVADDAADQPVLAALLRGLSSVVRSLRSNPGPVVIASHGAALAGGCALLGGADVVVCSPDATFGYPAALIGVSPAVSAPFLRCSVNDGDARRLLLDTKTIDAAEAHRLGLVHHVAEPLRDEAMQIARALASKPAHAVRATSDWITTISGPTDELARRGLDASLACVGTEEARTRIENAARRR